MEKNQVHIPEGWKLVSQLGNLGKVFNGLNGKIKDDFGFGEPYIPYVNVFKNSKVDVTELDYVNVKKGEKQNSLEFGDIIFTTSSETIEEVGMTSVFLNKTGKYYLNSFCFIFRLNNNDWLVPEFSQYLFRTDNIRHSISLLGQGSTRYNLSKTRLLKELKLLIPSDPKEQTQIATILSKVDEAINQTEQLIAKYTRIKTGLMQDLLTKGIDENGNIRSEETHEFKDSPLGRIPKEWECDWLGNIAKIQTGGKDTQDKDDTGQYPFYVRSQIVERINSYSFDGEGILTAGDGVGVGKVFHYVNGKFDFHQRVYLIHEFRKDIIGKFIFLYFKENFIKQVDKYSAKNTVDSVRLHMIFEMDVPVLKFSEQKRIVEILDKNDSLVEYLEQELSKLKSLKTGLMQDLLSGKVRVNHLIKETASV